MKDYFILFNQFVIKFVIEGLFFLHKVEIINPPVMPKNNHDRYLIVSNHASKFDPFIITSFLSFNILLKLHPSRYLVTDRFFNNFFRRVFLYWCGCFSTSKKRNKGKTALETAQKFISEGETILIFPEGKLNALNSYDENISLGIGAIYLEKNNPNLFILPVRIEYLPKRHIRITFRKSFRHKKFPQNFYPLMEDTMKKIYA